MSMKDIDHAKSGIRDSIFYRKRRVTIKKYSKMLQLEKNIELLFGTHSKI